MGLGSLKTAWQRQTLILGHERSAEFSVLIMDNRGMGDSDKPLMRYSTSEMAADVHEVLAHVGFLDRPGRAVHVVGLSLGGMIAQELAVRIPGRLATLSLCCTAARVESTTSFLENLAARARLVLPRSLESSVRGTASQVFAPDWLARPDDVHLPQPGTDMVHMPACRGGGAGYGAFGSNYQRFVAQEVAKRLDAGRFSTRGYMLQLVAAGWHRKSPEQLAGMADAVGRERIMVLHGTADGMIPVQHGRKLVDYIRPGVGHIVEGMGHAPLAERWRWFTDLLVERFQAGEKMDGRQ